MKDLKPETVFAALLSYPGSSGEVRDWRGVIAKLQAPARWPSWPPTCWRWRC